jgi:DNA-binding CsgD family transcriptional regulator/tetratricopeptide (TPR) repeat protein
MTVLSRELELGAISNFFANGARSLCLVISGDAGIGKTTLWESGLAQARSQGLQVLYARGSEAEAALSFAALADLVEGIGPDVLQGIPSPQRHALEVAIRWATPHGPGADLLAVSSGFLSALRALAQHEALVVAIDDVHWLDGASAAALEFAARRLSGPQVRFLLSRRTGRWSGLERALRPAGVQYLELGALSLGAVTRLLAERLGANLPRQLARRVHDASQGNPLFALELGRALIAGGALSVGAELPVPDLVDDVFGARVGALSTPSKRVLLAMALDSSLSNAELTAVVGPTAVEEAAAAGLVVVDGARARPAHPMLAAAARQRSSSSERRALHAELASAVSDPALRARHMALAAMGADRKLATTVAAASQIALERGAVQDAEELAAHALRLTPPDAEEYPDRLLALAGCHVQAGEVARAAELLTGRMAEIPPGRARALAHLLLVDVAPVAEEQKHLEKALAEGGHDPRVRAEVLARKARALIFRRLERIDEAELWAAQAVSVAAGVGGEMSVMPALVWARTLGGRPIDDLAPATPAGSAVTFDQIVLQRPLCVRLAFRGQVGAARAGLRQLLAMTDERGEYRTVRQLQFQLCELELRCGDASEASKLLAEIEPWAMFEERTEAALAHDRLRAVLGAVTGDPEGATLWATKVLEAEEVGDLLAWDRLEARRVLGVVGLFEHDAVRAAEHFQSVWDHTVHQHIDDPGAFPVSGDLVEALAEAGNIAAAGAVTERLSQLAVEQRHPWGLATAARCSAVVALTQGYQEAATATLSGAAEEYGRLGLHFDRGRALLWLGRAQRRARKRSEARRSLQGAEECFSQMGSPGWADQARSELARVSGRRPAETDQLTAGEQQVANLVVEGLSNKEIAERLFVSVSTVETHLSHVYAKLGTRSRGQLARLLSDHP